MSRTELEALFLKLLERHALDEPMLDRFIYRLEMMEAVERGDWEEGSDE